MTVFAVTAATQNDVPIAVAAFRGAVVEEVAAYRTELETILLRLPDGRRVSICGCFRKLMRVTIEDEGAGT
ncbi:MAG: hypothetical protein PHD55_11535 [Methanoregula sp.]|jgi:hypothetical protein|nr:hypothetical protein [Methanoregula sp.]